MEKSFLKFNKNIKGFTLIELLVVVAIIGILSGVVLASLNSAREKGKISSIKSTLKQLYNQASINQLENGSYANSNDASLNCTGPGNNLLKIVQPLIDQGVFIKCYSVNSAGFKDESIRFGATALIYDTGELKAWTVDENGVAKWDTYNLSSSNPPGSGSKVWSDALAACVNNGGRLPSIEQVKTLPWAWRQGSGDTTWTPVGVPASNVYWTSTAAPSAPTTSSYYQHMDNTYGGASSVYAQTNAALVRCVR